MLLFNYNYSKFKVKVNEKLVYFRDKAALCALIKMSYQEQRGKN